MTASRSMGNGPPVLITAAGAEFPRAWPSNLLEAYGVSVRKITELACPTWSELMWWLDEPHRFPGVAQHVEGCGDCAERLELIRVLEEERGPDG